MSDERPAAWLRRAADSAASGALLAYPTETSWGLGADATNATALQRLRRFKGGRGAKPFSVLVSGYPALAALGFEPNREATDMARRFWPGPLTLVLPCRAPWAAAVGREDGAVAVRCSSHPVAMLLCQTLERRGLGPLTSTSLNRSSEAPAQSYDEALAFCDDRGEVVLAAPAGARAGGGAASTIVDTTGSAPALLRPGALGCELLADWVPAP